MHGSKWIPDGKLYGSKNDALKNKHLEYFYKRHRLDVEVKGLYYIIDACLRSSIEACAQDLVVFAIKQAKPAFSTLGDGYMGLSTGSGFDNAMESSLLYQMYDSGMIKSKVFGVHTHMFNSTQDPSQIRFGGFNEKLFEEGHDLMMIETSSKSSWQIKFNSAGFHSE